MRNLALILGGDIIIALCSLCFVFIVLFGTMGTVDESWQTIALQSLVFVVIVLFTAYISEIYSHQKSLEKKELLFRIAISVTLAYLSLSILYYLIPTVKVGYWYTVLALSSFGLFQFAWHYWYKFILRVSGMTQKVIILGSGSLARQIEEALENTSHDFALAGFIDSGEGSEAVSSKKILGKADVLVETAINEKVQKIVICLPERRGVLPIEELLKCKFNGIDIDDAVSFYEQLTGKLLLEKTNPGWFIFSSGFGLNPCMHFLKRKIDILVCLAMMIVCSPLMPLIALIIKMDSPGPVFFKQVRVGQKEREFEIYKFRTMCQEAECDTGAVWAEDNDPRITRVGKVLRKTRLDEIPQLINVLKGEMSFVGPRPERPEFVETLKKSIPYYSKRHSVKPGITGWAQVNYPYGASVEDALEKLRYDLYYIKHYSIFFDLQNILETLKVVFLGRGAR